ncbi:MAG: hypothetical protein AAB503_02260 [Patescibacteria group bacterium]
MNIIKGLVLGVVEGLAPLEIAPALGAPKGLMGGLFLTGLALDLVEC